MQPNKLCTKTSKNVFNFNQILLMPRPSNFNSLFISTLSYLKKSSLINKKKSAQPARLHIPSYSFIRCFESIQISSNQFELITKEILSQFSITLFCKIWKSVKLNIRRSENSQDIQQKTAKTITMKSICMMKFKNIKAF